MIKRTIQRIKKHNERFGLLPAQFVAQFGEVGMIFAQGLSKNNNHPSDPGNSLEKNKKMEVYTMATMATEVYRAFRKAGVSEYIATAAASVIPYKNDIADLVTKQDLSDVQIEVAELRAELKRDAAKWRAEEKQDRAELKQDIAEISGEVAAELKGKVAKLCADEKQDRAELKSELRVLKVVYAPILISLLVALIGLHFFV